MQAASYDARMTATAARFDRYYAYDRGDRRVLAELRTKGLRSARHAYAVSIGVPADKLLPICGMTLRQARTLPAFVALEAAAR